MRAYDNRAGYHWGKIHKVVFHRVAVDGGYSSRCCPLVVRLVNVLVETRVVEKPEGEGRQRQEKLQQCNNMAETKLYITGLKIHI